MLFKQYNVGGFARIVPGKATFGIGLALLAAWPSVAFSAEPSISELAAEIKALKERVKETDTLKAEIRELRASITKTRSESRRTSAKVNEVAARKSDRVVTLPEGTPPPPAGSVPAFVTVDKQLQFGAITITPGGYLAGESVFRTRTVNSDVATNFAGIPFSNSPLAHLNEIRPSGRQTRLALLAEGAITPSMLAGGYAEFDFLGASSTANSIETNSYTPRIRHLYATLDANDYGMHVLAGQTWSLVTLNSKGITPRNEVTPNVIDSSQTIGSIYARQPQIRLTKDFGKRLWVSLSAEESETTFSPGCATAVTGPTGAVNSLTPSTANAGITPSSGTINSITCGVVGSGAFANTTNYSLNHVPDVVAKAAYEARIADRDVHLEAFGIYTNLYDRVAGTDALGNNTFSNKNTAGWGAGAGIIVPVLPRRLDFQANALYGRGIGRYGPGSIAESTFNPDGSLRAIPELIALGGLTLHATPAIDIYAYGGVETSSRAYFQNPTSAAGVAGTYVGVGSPSIDNSGCAMEGAAATTCSGSTKTFYELTAGFWDKIYKGRFGELRGGVQYAYVKRELFSAPGVPTPKTDDNMVFTSFRYFPFQ